MRKLTFIPVFVILDVVKTLLKVLDETRELGHHEGVLEHPLDEVFAFHELLKLMESYRFLRIF